MSVLTIVLVSIAVLVALIALTIAWRLRRAQRREDHVHGYGPPIVVFPPPSDTRIKPAERRRAEMPAAATPYPAAAQGGGQFGDGRPVGPAGDGRAPSNLPHGADIAASGASDGGLPAGGMAASASHHWQHGIIEGDSVPAAADVRSLDAAARIREVERKLRDDMELPLRVEQEQSPDQPGQPEPASRPIRRRRTAGLESAAPEMDGALALAASASVSPAASPRPMPPAGGTLQMLPGRLVIVEGEEAGRELRFVRLGANPQTVTVGRNAGRPYEHVQLKAQTVSRLHARLQYDEGRWSVENLSRTNPLVVNGRAVAAGAAPRVLSDGDMIEVGEVLLRFHAR